MLTTTKHVCVSKSDYVFVCVCMRVHASVPASRHVLAKHMHTQACSSEPESKREHAGRSLLRTGPQPPSSAQCPPPLPIEAQAANFRRLRRGRCQTAK